MGVLGLGTIPPAANVASNCSRSCRICRASLTPEAEFCGTCGAQNPTSGSVKCGRCGAEIPINESFCSKCGARGPHAQSQTTAARSASSPSVSPAGNEYSPDSVSPYYQREFAKMHANSSYEGKWNWAAFFWGGLWALTKGLWGPVLLCVAVLIFTAPIGGLPALLMWFYFGARGNSMFYKKAVLGQPWACW